MYYDFKEEGKARVDITEDGRMIDVPRASFIHAKQAFRESDDHKHFNHPTSLNFIFIYAYNIVSTINSQVCKILDIMYFLRILQIFLNNN